MIRIFEDTLILVAIDSSRHPNLQTPSSTEKKKIVSIDLKDCGKS